MEEINQILQIIYDSKFLTSLLIIVISYFLYKILRGIIDKGAGSNKIVGKKLTYLKLFGNILKYVFVVVTILIILKVNGVDVDTLLAGLGIAGIVVAFAIQDFLKDIIAGLNLITDNVFKIGDVIKYKDVEGKVLSIGLKYTKIQDIYNNDIFVVSNGNIQEVVNVSDRLDIKIPTSYNDDVKELECVFTGIVEIIKTYEHVKNCEYIGITDFKDSSISHKIRIYCNPTKKLRVRRKALRCIKVTLDENNIKIPFNQLDIHLEK